MENNDYEYIRANAGILPRAAQPTFVYRGNCYDVNLDISRDRYDYAVLIIDVEVGDERAHFKCMAIDLFDFCCRLRIPAADMARSLCKHLNRDTQEALARAMEATNGMG